MDEIDFQRIAFEEPPEDGVPDFWKKAALYTERQCDAAIYLHRKECLLAMEVLDKHITARESILAGGDPGLADLKQLRENLAGRVNKINILLDRQKLLDHLKPVIPAPPQEKVH